MKSEYIMKVYQPVSSRLQAALLRDLPRLLPAVQVTRAARASGSAAADLVVEVRTPSGRRHRLYVQTRIAGAPSRIPQAIRSLKAALPPRAAGYPVLASAFLSSRARDLCREAGVGYVDLAGNCFLQLDDFYLQKVVDRNPFPHRGRPPSCFSPVSSRILRALLEEPARTWHVSELAAATRVSLGQSSNVCRRLLEEGYAERTERRLRLRQPAHLLEAWRDRYTIQQHTLTGYYSFEQDPRQFLRRLAAVAGERRLRYALTSFAAAQLVAPFVAGVRVVHWYVEDALAIPQWVDALDLRPVEEGPNAMLLVPVDAGVFYRTQAVDGVTLAGNVQLYLDLASDPARGKEQADFLRQQRLGY